MSYGFVPEAAIEHWALNTRLYKTPPLIIHNRSVKVNYDFTTFWKIITLNKHISYHHKTPPDVTLDRKSVV